MARTRTRIPLNVYLNSRLVGRLRRQAGGAIDFHYAPAWLAWEHALPVSLSLPLREDRYIGDPVIAVFDNLMPDSEQVRRRLAEHVRAEGIDAYSLLAKIGRDCAGALQFLPDGLAPGPPGAVAGRAVGAGAIAAKIAALSATPLGVDEAGDLRISIAGAQDKTAFLFWKNKWHVPSGATATTHIMKPQIGVLSNGIDLRRSVENEFLCMKLAAAFALPTANVAIADFASKRVLVVERFDRSWTKDKRLLRLPQEDCCQALSVPPARKYETAGGPGMNAVLDLLSGSDEPALDRRLYLKAQIVFWLLGATDGHAKNFSIFLQPGGRFRLTPLYDVMSAQPALDAGQLRKNKMKFALAVGTRRHYAVHEILPRHFVQTAAESGIPAAAVRDIFDELAASATDAIERATTDLPPGFPAALVKSIVEGVNKRVRLLKTRAQSV